MRRLLRSPLALLAAVAAMRSAAFAFGVLNIDESDYLVFGTGFWHGMLPYRDLLEIKPPLGFLTYALPEAANLSILPVHALGLVWVFCTALLLGKAAERWLSSPEAGSAAAWLYLLATACEVPSFNSEIMMNLPTAAGLYFFARWLRSERAGSMIACGFFLGCASLYKHQGAVSGVALGLWLLRRRNASGFFALLAGAVAPWAIAAGAYAAIGQWPAFFECVFSRNLSYAGQGSAGSTLLRGLAATALCVGATIVPWWLALREAFSKRPDPARSAFVLLLALTVPAVAVGGRFYEHYYLQFAPPLAVLGAPLAVDAFRRKLPVALAALCLLGNAGYAWARGLTGHYPAQDPRAVEVGRFIRDRSGPDDRLFVWGHYTPLYVLAQRLPGTRYCNTSMLMGNFDPQHLGRDFDASAHRSERDVRLALDDLREKRPALVVDTAPADIHGWSRVPLHAFPEIEALVARCYRPIGHPAGAAVYRLDERLPGCGKGAR